MPYSMLSEKQLVMLLDEYPRLMSTPGVALITLEYLGRPRGDAAVFVTVYAGHHNNVSSLPVSVAGLPVIVRVEDYETQKELEVIDPRKHGGAWPPTNHHGA